MRLRTPAIAAASLALAATAITMTSGPVAADSARPGQSMTHIKTTAGLSATLEGAGVVLYAQGGATSAVMGDSIAAPNGQVVFHVPITAQRGGLQHQGSVLVFFNTAGNRQAQLQNPVIDVTKGVVTAVVPQSSSARIPVLSITNAGALKPKVTRAGGVRTTSIAGAQLAIAPGAGPALESLLGLPSGALPDGTSFGTADITLSAAARR